MKSFAFSKAVVGDKVWDWRLGEGVILAIDNDAFYPIHVLLGDECERSYSWDGRLIETDINPSLFVSAVDVNLINAVQPTCSHEENSTQDPDRATAAPTERLQSLNHYIASTIETLDMGGHSDNVEKELTIHLHELLCLSRERYFN